MVSTNDAEEALLFNLVYCSRAERHMGGDEITRLVSQARSKNSRNHITGWLVYSSGIFFQWLEGSADDVKRLMTDIAADERHSSIVVLSEAEEVRERLFSDWDMELVSPDDIRAVLFDAIDSARDAKSLGALRLLVEELDRRSPAA